jgi:AcrR family transcriptional regulator
MKAKEKILQEALKLFSVKGYAETSTDEIIMNSGISKGLLFYHYENKDGLLKTILEHAWEIIQGSCDIDISDKSPGRALRAIIRQMAGSLKRDYYYWKVYTAVLLNTELSKKFEITLHNPSMAYRNLTIDLFRKLDKKNPERWAFSFDIHFKGIYFGYISEPESFPLEQAKQVMIDMFTR